MLKQQINHVLQPIEYHIALEDYKYLIFHCHYIGLAKAHQRNFTKRSHGSTENSSRCRLYNGVYKIRDIVRISSTKQSEEF
jgi:hypothetical protein